MRKYRVIQIEYHTRYCPLFEASLHDVLIYRFSFPQICLHINVIAQRKMYLNGLETKLRAIRPTHVREIDLETQIIFHLRIRISSSIE